MKEQMGVGIIGLGTISDAHIQAIKESKFLKLVGVSSRTKSKAEKVSDVNKCKMYKEYIDLIKDKEVSLVVILTPPGKYEGLIKDCATHGKHIFVEKPIGTDLNRIRDYLSLCAEKSVKVSVVSQHRFDKATTFAKEKIDYDSLGNPSIANCIVNWFRDNEYYDSWHNTHSMSGGGVLAIQAIHTIDLMLYLMGDVISVKGFSTQIRDKKMDVEDTAGACVRFATGALGVISATTSAHPGTPSRLELMGDKGSLTILGEDISFYESTIDTEEYKSEETGKESSFSDPGKISIDSLKAQYKDVERSINEGRESIVSGEVAKKTYEVIDAIYKSSKTGKEIYITKE